MSKLSLKHIIWEIIKEFPKGQFVMGTHFCSKTSIFNESISIYIPGDFDNHISIYFKNSNFMLQYDELLFEIDIHDPDSIQKIEESLIRILQESEHLIDKQKLDVEANKNM